MQRNSLWALLRPPHLNSTSEQQAKSGSSKTTATGRPSMDRVLKHGHPQYQSHTRDSWPNTKSSHAGCSWAADKESRRSIQLTINPKVGSRSSTVCPKVPGQCPCMFTGIGGGELTSALCNLHQPRYYVILWKIPSKIYAEKLKKRYIEPASIQVFLLDLWYICT